jgi:hypothetical protein
MSGFQASGSLLQQIEAQQLRDRSAAEEHKRQMAAQGLNPDGSPIRKAFDSLVDSSTGQLGANYTMSLSGLDPSQWDGYSKYKNEALRTGPSAWAGLQNQTVDAQTMQNKESAARQANSGMNQGLSNLALHGGTSGGARALAAVQSSRDMLNARQQAARSGDMSKLGVATTDEQNRIGQLGTLASSEQNIGQYNKTLEGKQREFNIQNLLRENDSKRAYNDLTYTEQMKKWAADKQAQATSSSGGGGKK